MSRAWPTSSATAQAGDRRVGVAQFQGDGGEGVPQHVASGIVEPHCGHHPPQFLLGSLVEARAVRGGEHERRAFDPQQCREFCDGDRLDESQGSACLGIVETQAALLQIDFRSAQALDLLAPTDGQ